ncbi:hypothetical protein G6O67_007610 [Ophiocordyceps sinensis]|uniref:Hydroxynaphthalene reductase-like protein Arp2 n=1 Tax=Ophiocordyceps sinensis TaxID=72228 RepID=A0A8H4PLD0_9HYPO|nr:hypothetical protein G6O67_007610 [Ophiocordyceps sinensis]
MNSDTCPPACPSSRDPPRPSRDQLRPSRSLAGKVAIVTGAGSRGDDEVGNGRAISLLLAEDGASVVCVDRELRLAERTAAMIEHEAGSGRAVAWRADVSREGECAGTVEAALRAFGRVDVLVNNVGVLGPTGTATEAEVEAWARGLEVNVTSMMLMVKHAVPAMAGNEAEAGIRGAIVNMGSVAGLRGGTPSLLYPTSKGAVVNMTRAMAAHHGGQGIRVNCVCPGMLYTPMVYGSSAQGMAAEMREARRRGSLLQTEGNAWDCAGAVRFLAGGEARWITGTVLTVDAGASCVAAIVVPDG